MSRISDATLHTLLEDISDYESLELSQTDIDKLESICDRWEDRDSIESEINEYIQTIGYDYDDKDSMWVKV